MTNHAIPFIYRRSRTMSDGTLRIEVDVAPADALNAFTLFNLPDVPGAMVRMTQESAQAACQQETIRAAVEQAIDLPKLEPSPSLKGRIVPSCTASLSTLTNELYDNDDDTGLPGRRIEAEKPKPDKLVTDIALMCKEPAFKKWVSAQGIVADEQGCAWFVRDVCRVVSRAEIRTGTEAAEIFHSEIRGPYAKWCEENIGQPESARRGV